MGSRLSWKSGNPTSWDTSGGCLVQPLLNQHSYILAVVVVLALAVPLTLRFVPGWWQGIALGAVVVALATFLVVLRTGGSTLESAEAVEAAIASGQPALVEFYSNY